MVSVKFYCQYCKKAYHIDELDYSSELKQYFCPGSTCGTSLLELYRAEHFECKED